MLYSDITPNLSCKECGNDLFEIVKSYKLVNTNFNAFEINSELIEIKCSHCGNVLKTFDKYNLPTFTINGIPKNIY